MPGPAAAAQDEEGFVPIPQRYWDRIPPQCQARYVRICFAPRGIPANLRERSVAALRDQAPKLTLEDIIELARINSREYQAQKETLYRAA